MPELPEVETVRSQLEPGLVGRTFERVEIADGRLTRPESPDAVAAELQGERVEARAPPRQVPDHRFESGRTLLVHLRMTGGFTHPAQPNAHRRAEVLLDDGTTLAYTDTRRFGTWLLLEPGELDAYLDDRGSASSRSTRAFTTARFAVALAGRRAPIKARAARPARGRRRREHLRGRGALARAHPSAATRPASSTPEEIAELRKAVRAVLRLGIERSGSDAARLPRSERRLGLDAARVPGLRPRRRAVRALRHADREDRASPGAARGSARPASRSRRRDAASCPERSSSWSSCVAADRACRRSRSAERSSRRSAPRSARGSRARARTWISSNGMPALLEQHLGADAVAAPVRYV